MKQRRQQRIPQEEPSQQVAEATDTDSMDIDIARNEETEGSSTRSGKTYAVLEQEQQIHIPVITLESIAAGEDDKGISSMLTAPTESMESVETEEVIQAWLMTLNALLDLGSKGEAAVKKEIRAIIDHGSWRVARHTGMTEREM